MATLTEGSGAFQAAYAALFLSCAHCVAPCGALAVLTFSFVDIIGVSYEIIGTDHIARVSIKWCCRARCMATLTKCRNAFQAVYAAVFLSCAHFVAPCGTLAILCLRRPIARLSNAWSALFKLRAFCRALWSACGLDPVETHKFCRLPVQHG